MHPLAADMLELAGWDELPGRFRRHERPQTAKEIHALFVGHLLQTLWYDRMIFGFEPSELASTDEVAIVPGPFC